MTPKLETGGGPADASPLVAIFGMPNAGKTSVFNALTGSHYRTVNYPGSTVDFSLGRISMNSGGVPVLDLPGVTSLTPHSHDEFVALKALFGGSPHGVPCAYLTVVDSTQLERHLYPAKRLLDAGYPLIVALTMVDILEQRKEMIIDVDALSRELRCPVVRIDGRSGRGTPALRDALEAMLKRPPPHDLTPPPTPTFEEIADQYETLKGVASRVIRPKIGEPTAATALSRSMPDRLTARLDRLFLHPVLGVLLFSATLAVIFTSIFWVARPLMDLVDQFFSLAAVGIAAALPDSWFTHLLTDGVIVGMGAVAIFVPQIVVLFLALGFLEDSGYLSRGAMIVDRFLSTVGLSGRSFVPILSGFACAIPAMLATRTIPSRRERLLTILILPLMLCSARLPVYGLLLAFVTPPGKPWIGGLALTGLYLFSAVSGMIASVLTGRVLNLEKRSPSPLLLELPSIRPPKPRVVLATTYHRARSYVKGAGGAILVVSVLLWTLTHVPSSAGLGETQQLSSSIAALLGRWMEPIMRPLGLDWRVGVALICAFAAREVFVGALALVLMVSTSGDALQAPLLLAMRDAVLPDGTPLFTISSCAGLIVFFIFALQCVSTVAVSRKETGGWRIPVLQLLAFNAIAYGAAFTVVQGLRLVGVS